jgi:hypothetical protein
MSKREKLPGGQVRAYWLGDVHERALAKYQSRYQFKSRGAALRKILEIVAESEGVEIDESTT